MNYLTPPYYIRRHRHWTRHHAPTLRARVWHFIAPSPVAVAVQAVALALVIAAAAIVVR